MRSQNNINYNILLRLYISRININNRAQALLKAGGQALLKTGGQVLLEYGVILALIITTLIGIQLYMQRELQARYKDAVDYAVKEIEEKAEVVSTLQYDPYYEESDITTTSSSKISSSYSPGGSSAKTYETISRKGQRSQLPYPDEVEE